MAAAIAPTGRPSIRASATPPRRPAMIARTVCGVVHGDAASSEHRRLRRLRITAAFGAAVVTILVATVPSARFAYENLTLHAATETAEALIAALLAYLSLGRLRRTQQISDVALTCAFSVFGGANFFSAAGVVAGVDERAAGFATWVAVLLRLLGAAAFCAAAVAPARRFDVGLQQRRQTAGGLGAGHRRPPGHDGGPLPGSRRRPCSVAGVLHPSGARRPPRRRRGPGDCQSY